MSTLVDDEHLSFRRFMSVIFKTKVSLKRRCFQQCLELENLIKYDAGWYIFFVAMLNSS